MTPAESMPAYHFTLKLTDTFAECSGWAKVGSPLLHTACYCNISFQLLTNRGLNVF